MENLTIARGRLKRLEERERKRPSCHFYPRVKRRSHRCTPREGRRKDTRTGNTGRSQHLARDTSNFHGHSANPPFFLPILSRHLQNYRSPFYNSPEEEIRGNARWILIFLGNLLVDSRKSTRDASNCFTVIHRANFSNIARKLRSKERKEQEFSSHELLSKFVQHQDYLESSRVCCGN